MLCRGLGAARLQLLAVCSHHILKLLLRSGCCRLEHIVEHRAERSTTGVRAANGDTKRLIGDGKEAIELAVVRTVGCLPHRECLQQMVVCINDLKTDARGRFDSKHVGFDKILATGNRRCGQWRIHGSFATENERQKSQP